jgi:hypothetical protein
LPNQPPRPSQFTDEDRKQRVKAFAELKSRVEALGNKIVRDKRDAFFELVQYPVGGSALANERYFRGEMAALATDQTEAHELAGRATAADQQLKDLTRIFNEDLAGGKWRGILQLEPADRQWRSMRVAAWEAPQFPVVNPATRTNQKAMVTNQPESAPSGLTERAGVVAINAGDFTRRMSRAGAQWQRVTGLGRTGDAVTILPTTMPAVPREAAVVDAPVLEYEMNFAKAGDFPVQLFLLPTQAILPGGRQRIAIGCDEQRPQEVVIKCPDSGADWSQGVLDATRVGESKVMIPSPGKHVIRVYGLEAGVVFDKIVMDWGHSFSLNHR